MRILIIRHGDPDYTIDSLTEKGHREATLLAERIAPMDIAAYYISPLDRAKATVEYSLKRCGRTAETLDWLHEGVADLYGSSVINNPALVVLIPVPGERTVDIEKTHNVLCTRLNVHFTNHRICIWQSAQLSIAACLP